MKEQYVKIEENSPNVKPCPKCGTDALVCSFDGMSYVRCRVVICNTRTPWSVSRDEVVEIWNGM